VRDTSDEIRATIPEPLPPRVSVVIATLNRPQLLHRCLGALSDQTLPFADFEIVVADDGPHCATEAVVREWQRRCPEYRWTTAVLLRRTALVRRAMSGGALRALR
jgi:cellulose synthase/poly-beta-1,6-N-acetylglucosamine synthase-like glycosyltransferase